MSTQYFCDQCGNAAAVTDNTCPACGADLPIFPVAESKSFVETAIAVLRPSVKYWPFAAAAVGILLLTPSARGAGGQWSLDWGIFLLLSSPLIAGWLIAFTQSAVGRQLERFEIWMVQHREAAMGRDGTVSRWVLRPIFWTFAQISALTARISDAHIRSGIKFASYVYFVLIVLYLAIMATAIFLFLVGLAIVGFVISLFDSSSPRRNPEDLTRRQRVLTGEKGSTLVRGSSFLNQRDAGRVDKDGNIYEGSNFLNEKKVGRIDDAGNVYQGTNFLNESKAGRIDDDGHIIQGTNSFNEKRTGRIDSDGNVYEGTNFLNEENIGKVRKEK